MCFLLRGMLPLVPAQRQRLSQSQIAVSRRCEMKHENQRQVPVRSPCRPQIIDPTATQSKAHVYE